VRWGGEEALEELTGCAVIISRERMLRDHMAAHMLAYEGNSHFEGNLRITKPTRSGGWDWIR
jgi:hypothetical protein